MARLVVVALVLAACSSGPSRGTGDGGTGDGRGGSGSDGSGGGSDNGIYADGSRLVWQKLSTSDGLEAEFGLYDKQLGTTCTMYAATDGEQRCMPFGSVYVGSFFADAGCTTPIAYALCPASPPAYAYTIDTSSRVTEYPIVGSHGGAVYYGTPANCYAYTSTYAFFDIGSPVAPTTFAAVQNVSGQAKPGADDLAQDGTRLRLQTISSSDGMRGPWYLFTDSQLSEDCYFTRTGDGAQRCSPSKTAVLAGYYGDSSCAQPIYETYSTTLDYDYAYGLDTNNCPSSSYYRIGNAHTGTAYYRSGATCAAQSPDTRSYYEVTPFAVTSFEDGTLSSANASYTGFHNGSRLTLKLTTGSDGARAFSGLYDTNLGVDCYFGTAADGQLRCIPTLAAYTGTYYSDASCTQPLAYYTTCSAPQIAVSAPSCSAAMYFQLGAAYSGPTYIRNGANCIAQAAAAALYRIGSSIPVSALAGGTLSP